MIERRRAAWVAILALSLAYSPVAAAAPCSDLPSPTIGLGGSAAKPLLALFAAELAALPEPVSLVFQSTTSCFGITAYIDDTPMTGTASFWDTDGVEQTCELPVVGITPDYGLLSIEPTLCEGVTAVPDGIGEFIGPVTPWSMIVPVASSQTTISAEAIYFAYGFGASEGMVAPWTVDAELYARNATASSQIALAIAANIPIGKFKGVDTMTAPNMVTSVAMSPEPEAALGFVGAEVADLNRDTIRTLAFQAYDQTCGYWPDSTSTAFDKQNVRDGHYFIWTPYRFYAPVDRDGVMVHDATRTAIGSLTGVEPIPADFPALDLTIDNGSIPRCAMQVWRDEEVGPLVSYQPEEPCGCYYDFRATGSSSCTTCEMDDECPAESPVCRHGYCEAI
ncbi:MAG TPA: hypothetical protein VFG69_17965 [Nannocystaceae bacterium]|nr:hypothetical protein [Nannocystaceae bacterium]